MSTQKQLLASLVIIFQFVHSGFSQTGYIQYWFPTGIDSDISYFENHDYKLMDDENISFHFKADYFNTDDQKAEILAVQTNNQCYLGSLNMYSRSDQTRLIRRDEYLFDELSFVITEYQNPEKTVFYTCQFSMVENNHLSYLLVNPWVDSEYSSYYRILNFYLTSDSKELLEELLDEMIWKFDKQCEIEQLTDKDLIPDLTIKQCVYKNGQLNLTIDNGLNESRMVDIDLNIKSAEGSFQETSSIQLDLGSGIDEYLIDDLFLYDAEISISEDGELLDQFYIRDASWTFDESNLVYNYQFYQDFPEGNTGEFTLERGIKLIAQDNNPIILEKELCPNGFSFDISQYNHFSFVQEGIKHIEIEFYDQDVLRSSIPRKPVSGINHINLTKSNLKELSHLRIVIYAKDDNEQIGLSKLKFFNQYNPTANLNSSEVLATAYPNPCTDQVHFQFPNSKAIRTNYTVIDSHGQNIETGSCITQSLKLNTSTYQEGLYYLVYEDNTEMKQIVFSVYH